MQTIKVPAVVPTEVGRPCWDREAVAVAVPRIAQLDESRVDYFLASHTPIRGLRDTRTGDVLGEEEFFAAITDPSHGDVLALVHGDPGTGKSHLIHWLNLRLRQGLGSGEFSGVLPVLVQRRSGSLRDALEQLVQQLPGEFGHYLAPIRNAIDQITPETARRELAAELSMELGVRRAARARSPITGDLRRLEDVVASPGFRDWLSREGGPIDRSVRLLSVASEVEERDAPPAFAARDFLIEDARYKRDNTPAVASLIYDLEDEPELRELAAWHFNEVLPDALREVTKLTGSLREVFDRIRADLRGRGESLAVFVEDVSVMSALDQEVVNIFEPQGRDDLCRTIAVLGLTRPGMQRLRDNQKQRATHLVAVDEGVGAEWITQRDEVARFTARYLNTLRLPRTEVADVAQRRRASRGDVNASACGGCPVREECHATFGSVELDGVRVGTFPFSVEAPQRLVGSLNEASEGVRRNPRGLLMHVVHPVVAAHPSLEDGAFPSLHLAVHPTPLPYWSAFEERFCGGWTGAERARLKTLAQFWIQAESADEAASELARFLGPLQFPQFTEVAPERKADGADGTPRQDPEPQGREPRTHPKLDRLLRELEAWMGGADLPDARPRELLATLVRQGIRWEDQREVPQRVWRELLNGYEWVSIEGMRSKRKNRSAFAMEFDRSEETRDLVESLAQHQWTGGGSWDFADGERHKRRVAGWLRRNQHRVLALLQPREGLSREEPVRAAVQFLAAASLAARRFRLPNEADRRIAAVLAPPSEAEPTALSTPWTNALILLRAHHARIRDFLLAEITVPQGTTGGINFVDPLPIFQALASFEGEPRVDGLDERYFTNFWSSRYAALEPLEQLGTLARYGAVERAALNDLLDTVRASLVDWGYENGDLAQAFQAFFTDLTDEMEAEQHAEVFTGTPLFPEHGPRQLVERVKRWVRAMSSASEAATSTDVVDAILFDPAPLREADEHLHQACRHLEQVERWVQRELEDIRHSGDADDAATGLLGILDAIAAAHQPEPVEVP